MFNSVKTKIFVLTISVSFVLSAILICMSLIDFKNDKKLIIQKNDFNITTFADKINKEIVKLENNAVDLALMGEGYYHTGKEQRQGNLVVKKTFENYKDSLGGGIWFKPYTVEPTKKLSCIYGYRNNKDEVVIDKTFESEAYDYLHQSWWEEITPVLSKNNKVGWSRPYLESIGSEELMTTVGAAIYDGDEIVGISTVDWKISSIVNTIAQMKPTPNSFALFADKNNDFIIVSSDKYLESKNLLGKSLKEIPWYNKDLKNTQEINYQNQKYISFVKTLDNGMLFVVNIPEDEMLAQSIQQFAMSVVLLLLMIILITIGLYYVLKININKPIDKLIEIANDIGNGNLDNKIRIEKPQEFAKLAKTFNKMKDDIKSYIENINTAAIEKERMKSELSIAKAIQASALPSTFYPDMKEFKLFASMDTAKEVGGDFYDFFFINSHQFMFLIADVSGKGIPAALFMMTTKTLIKNLANEHYQPKELIERINNQICENNKQGYFVTMLACIVDIKTGKVALINAGHNPPLIKRNNEHFEYLKLNSNLVLGAYGNFKYNIEEITLNPNDMILLYTDGVTEALNKNEELYGEERFINYLNLSNNDNIDDLSQFINNIKSEIKDYSNGHEQSDDITLVAFKYNGYKEIMEEKIKLPAEIKSFSEFNKWLEEICEKYQIPMNYLMKLQLVSEEIFVNIASYAYLDEPDNKGNAEIIFSKDGNELTLKFIDNGTPYDPLKKDDPDITLSAQERPIGGLGIFMVKQYVDDINYEYRDEKNILTLKLIMK